MKFSSLTDAAEQGKLKRLLERYLDSCRPPEDGGRKGGRFPNLAGFCRWLGFGVDAAEELKITHPDAAGYLIAVMEDEALNSPVLSPTVVSAYLKRRLSYGERTSSGDPTLSDCGKVRLVFEHDIVEDGE